MEVLRRETQGRPPVQIWGRHTMVSSIDPLASLIALDVLRAGGNAADASIALSAALTVVNPNFSGLAGDSAWLIYWAQTGEMLHLDGYSTCSDALTPDRN